MTAKSCNIRQKIGSVMVYPWRISLDTPNVETTVPQLRGVWGAALHDLDNTAYEDVFRGTGSPHDRSPTYVMRPAEPDPSDAPALEWIVIDEGVYHLRALFRAWEIAADMGLGPYDNRHRFRLRRLQSLRPDGTLLPASWNKPIGWPLAEALRTDPPKRCRLMFPAPLRLLRSGSLLMKPRLPDIIVASIRRLNAYIDPKERKSLRQYQSTLITRAEETLARPWEGQPCDLIRYSGRQKQVLEYHGVVGYLDLPDGPGDLWPFIVAAKWLHIGKGTTVGMGQLVVTPMSP